MVKNVAINIEFNLESFSFSPQDFFPRTICIKSYWNQRPFLAITSEVLNCLTKNCVLTHFLFNGNSCNY